jgi:hypothetical protein
VFALAFIAHLDGYDNSEVQSLPLVLGLAGEALLAAGGYIGGTIVFVYGVRVLKRPQTPVVDALVPGRAEAPPAVEQQSESGTAAARPPGS